MTLDQHRVVEQLQQPLGHLHGAGLVGLVDEHGGELVAAQAHHEVVVAHARPQPLRHHAQQLDASR